MVAYLEHLQISEWCYVQITHSFVAYSLASQLTIVSLDYGSHWYASLQIYHIWISPYILHALTANF